MNRLIALLVALATAPAALAQGAETPAAPPRPAVDPDVVNGRVEVVETTLAELKSDVDRANTFVGDGLKLSAAWSHSMNGEKGEAAPSDPKADQYIAQLQAKF